jgi:hypothetical protein
VVDDWPRESPDEPDCWDEQPSEPELLDWPDDDESGVELGDEPELDGPDKEDPREREESPPAPQERS